MYKTLFRAFSIAAVLAMTLGTSYTARAMSLDSVPSGYSLVFLDNFTTLNPVWHSGHWWTKEGDLSTTKTNEQQAYSPANLSILNGMLAITARKQTVDVNGTPYNYTSGLAETGGDQYGYPYHFAFQYGYMEARIKIPAGQGLWPAFWLWPANYQDPPEIDNMEILGEQPQTTYMTYHFPGGGSWQQKYTGVNFSSNFHIFACKWTPTDLTWYIDGVEVASYTDAALVPHQPMYLILNLAVGGDWPGPVSDSVLPATMLVDWVKVYQNPSISSSSSTSLTVPVDDKSTSFTYSSGWTNVVDSRAYAGSYKLTGLNNSYVTLPFTGTSFSLLYTSGPAEGNINVYLDGHLVTTLSENSPELTFQNRWDYPGLLPAGSSHKLKLVFVGPANSKGTLDAVLIQK